MLKQFNGAVPKKRGNSLSTRNEKATSHSKDAINEKKR